MRDSDANSIAFLNTPSAYRTRFAPTPSGYLHLGNILSFAITAAIARYYGAKILLRIDDMDQQRASPLYVEDIFTTLDYLGIKWDEGPGNPSDFEQNWSQRHRLPLYNALLDKLRHTGRAFACRCSRAEILKIAADGHYPGICKSLGLPFDAPDAAWRVDTSNSGTIGFRNLYFGEDRHLHENVHSSILPPELDYFVVRKKDAFPAYQLASIADDVHFGINLIVRGADLLPSTIAQCFLARSLEIESFTQSVFYHHTLVADINGLKLSKSAGAMSVQYLRSHGLSASEILSQVSKLAGLGSASDWDGLVARIAGYYHP